MSDFFLDLSRNPFAKKLARKLHLPIPLPEPLLRGDHASHGPELSGLTIAIAGGPESRLAASLRHITSELGGMVAKDDSTGEALHALVFDGMPLKHCEDLGLLYDFIQPRLKYLQSNCRVILLANIPEETSGEAAAAAAAMLGFCKSLAKELGRRGGTCQLLQIARAAAEDPTSLRAPLAFFLSRRSAFISGQSLRIGASPSRATRAFAEASSLNGKVALVTGAAQGIGAAICRRLSAAGARVIGLDRSQEKSALLTLMTELSGTAFIFDLQAASVAADIAGRIAGEFGNIDILVNNAGITRDKTLARMPRDYFDAVMTINLQAPLRLTELLVNGEADLIKLMNPGGRVIMLASVAAIAGNAGQTNYSAAKAGLIGYVRAMAPQLMGRGITVNALAPGFIETRMTHAMPLAIRELARRLSSLGQGGLPIDVAEAALFFASPGAAGISGEVLRVCGQSLVGA